MAASDQEFFFVSNFTDLEDREKLREDQFGVLYAVEVTTLSSHDQHATLQQVLGELGRRGDAPTSIRDHEKFDTLYSFVKALPSGEVSKECRQLLGTELPQLLVKLTGMTARWLSDKANKDSSSRPQVISACRSAMKMYLFLLIHVLCAPLPGEEGTTLRKGKRMPRRAAALGDGEEFAGFDVASRENSLRAFNEILSSDVREVWPRGQVEEPVLTGLLRTCLHFASSKSNTEPEDNPVAEGLRFLLGNLAERFTSAFAAASDVVEEGGAVAAANPKDIIITPLVELLLKLPHLPKFCAKLLRLFDEQTADFARPFITMFLDSVTSAAMSDVGGDPQSAKNIASLLEDVATSHVSCIANNAHILEIHNCDSYDVRKCAMTCVAELIVQKYSGAQVKDEETERLRDQYLESLWVRIRDVNPFARTHCIRKWIGLCEIKCVPKTFHLRLVSEVVGRLQDKNHLVRRASMQLLQTCIKKNWFQSVLSLSSLQAKLSEHMAALKDSHASEDELKEALEVGREAYAQGKPIDATLTRVLFYEAAVKFVEMIHTALHHATTLLSSKTILDVKEAVEFIVTCSEYRVDVAHTAVMQVLVLIFSHEVEVQEAVRNAFADVFIFTFNASGGGASNSVKNLARAKKLMSVVSAANAGEIAALERICISLRGQTIVTDSLLDALFELIDSEIADSNGAKDRQNAMRLYSILLQANPKDILSRREAIVEVMCAEENKRDNVFLSFAVQALHRLPSSGRGFTPIDASVDPNEDPILSQIMHHLQRPTKAIATWLPLADACIGALHLLHQQPLQLYQHVVRVVADDYNRESDQEKKDIRLTQLFFILGHTAVKHLVSIDTFERAQMRKLDDPRGEEKKGGGAGMDVMHKELGMEGVDFKRYEIQQQCAAEKRKMLHDSGSMWSKYQKIITSSCSKSFDKKQLDNSVAVTLRTTSTLALIKLMLVSADFCEKNLATVFNILASPKEPWMVKTNCIVGLGDIACVHPNLLQPYVSHEGTGFFELLSSPDHRIRGTAVQVCSHLILNDMLRVADQIYTIVKLVADDDERIAHNATVFVQQLAQKNKSNLGNLIPTLISNLTKANVPRDKLQTVMKYLLEFVEKEKPTESLIEKLCSRLPPFQEEHTSLAQNLLFCLSELSFTTEKVVKKISSESCYATYRHWLRDEDCLRLMLAVVVKAKKGSPGSAERRDKAAIEEWEQRIQHDSRAMAFEEEEQAALSPRASKADSNAASPKVESGDTTATNSASPKGRDTQTTVDSAATAPDAEAPMVLESDESAGSSSGSDTASSESPPRKAPAKAAKAAAPKSVRGRKVKKEPTPEAESSDEESEEPSPPRKRPAAKKSVKPEPKKGKKKARSPTPSESEESEDEAPPAKGRKVAGKAAKAPAKKAASKKAPAKKGSK